MPVPLLLEPALLLVGGLIVVAGLVLVAQAIGAGGNDWATARRGGSAGDDVVCPQCHHKTPPDATNCPECGKEL